MKSQLRNQTGRAKENKVLAEKHLATTDVVLQTSETIVENSRKIFQKAETG
jgi:hypothetical protein